MTRSETVADNELEQELELQRRLLMYVTRHLNEDAIQTATDAISYFLSDVPECAEDMLRPLFDWSEIWPQQMAHEALGLSADEDFTVEELLERFEALESGQAAQASEKTDWREEGF